MTKDNAWRNDFFSSDCRGILYPRESLPVSFDRISSSIIFLTFKGFACGWAYWFAYCIGFAAQLVTIQNIFAVWLPDKSKYPSEIWITVFLILPVLFNYLNVRRYGEIEYWLTVIKVATFVGIIILGILLPMHASPDAVLLGTSADYQPVVCTENALNGTACLEPQGFDCIYILQLD